MKKALVYLGSFFPHEDAITNSLLPILEKMKSEYDIDIYTKSVDGKDKLYEEIDGYHVYRDKFFGNSKIRRYLFKVIQVRNTNLAITSSKNILIKKLIVGALNLLNDDIFDKLMNLGGKWYTSFNEVSKNNYDLILTVTSPIVSQYEGMKLHQRHYFDKCKWIAYYVDPFATYIRNMQHPDFNKFLAFETEVYKCADAVITSDEIKRDNLKYPMGKYDEKVYGIPFATLKFENNEIVNSDKYVCVYTGSLFDITVRNPEYFFKLSSMLPENIETIIVCNLTNKKVDELKKEYIDNKDNIKWYGRKSIEECFQLMNNADVLVNLGNECTNQTPSKVFDYIGRCKHIVNFYSLDEDTSKYYLEKYPYKINIKNKKTVDEIDLNNYIDFIYNSRKEKIDINSIKNSYEYLSAEKIAEEFMDILHVVEKENL